MMKKEIKICKIILSKTFKMQMRDYIKNKIKL